MTPSPNFTLRPVTNNADPTILGAVGTSDTTIALAVGGGAEIQTIYTGDASSTGSGQTLNDTGALGSLSVGDFIENVTDGSFAVVINISGAPNSVKTTPLVGGSDNTWQSGDVWAVNRQVLTLTKLDADGNIVKQERVLTTSHAAAADSFVCTRSFGGDTAQTFDDGDKVWVSVEATYLTEVQKAIRHIMMALAESDTGSRDYAAATNVSNAYTVNLVPKYTTLSDLIGKPVFWIPTAGNTGAATLNLNGTGAVAIKKEGGASELASADLITNMPVCTVYNGTYHVLVNAVANAPGGSTITINDKTSDYTIGSGEGGKMFTPNGASANIKFILPSAAAGLVVRITDIGSYGALVVPASGDTINFNSITSNGLFSRVAYDNLELTAYDATVWLLTKLNGIGWIVNQKAVLAGGWATSHISSLDSFDLIAETRAAVTATLTTATAAFFNACTPIVGYLIGGTTDLGATGVTAIQKCNLNGMTEALSSITATLGTGRSWGTSGSSRTKGYQMGGIASTLRTTCSTLTFASEAAAALAAVMTTAQWRMADAQSSTKVYGMSGSQNTGGTAPTANISAITFSTDAFSTLGNTFSAADSRGAGISAPLACYQMGGQTTATVIRKLTLSGETTSNLAATLDTGATAGGGVSGPKKGYCLGGEATTKVQDLDYAAETSAELAATMGANRGQPGVLCPWSI